jgi:cyclic pyranopterin monophosphate synthase
MKELSHTDKEGKIRMVDIGDKKAQVRIAKAEGFIHLNSETIKLIKDNNIKKGDVLTTAEVAGIMAAKRTSELIPLCHNINTTQINVRAKLKKNGVQIESEAKCIGQTGVEMEALTAVSVGLLTIYDMCKAVDKNMVIEQIKLIEKTKTDIN